MRIGLVGIDSSHAEDFLRHFNAEGRHPGLHVTALWGPHTPLARVDELLLLSPVVTAPASLEALLDVADAVIVGNQHGGRHAPHALAAIAAGKPVFVDKPLACSLADATAIVDAAEATGTPLLSASALRWQADTATLGRRLAAAQGPLSIRAYGTWYPDSEYGGAVFYAIHTIELLQELLGTSWGPLRPEPGKSPTVRCEWGRAAVSLSFRPLGDSGASAFGVRVTSPQTSFEQPIALPEELHGAGGRSDCRDVDG